VAILAVNVNVAVAEPTAPGRVMAAWLSLALITVGELLMREARRTAEGDLNRSPMSWAAARMPGSACS
jgi:hypothetical protein